MSGVGWVPMLTLSIMGWGGVSGANPPSHPQPNMPPCQTPLEIWWEWCKLSKKPLYQVSWCTWVFRLSSGSPRCPQKPKTKSQGLGMPKESSRVKVNSNTITMVCQWWDLVGKEGSSAILGWPSHSWLDWNYLIPKGQTLGASCIPWPRKKDLSFWHY